MSLVHLIPLYIATPAHRACSKVRKVKGKTPINAMSFGSLWSKLLSSAQPKKLRGAPEERELPLRRSTQAQCSNLPMRSWDWRTCGAIASFFQLTPAMPSHFMGHTCSDVYGNNLGNWAPCHTRGGFYHSLLSYKAELQHCPCRTPIQPAKDGTGFALLAHSLC